MNEARTAMVTIRLTPEEHARAEALADHYGLNIAAWFRMVAREKARELGVEPKKKPTK